MVRTRACATPAPGATEWGEAGRSGPFGWLKSSVPAAPAQSILLHIPVMCWVGMNNAADLHHTPLLRTARGAVQLVHVAHHETHISGPRVARSRQVPHQHAALARREARLRDLHAAVRAGAPPVARSSRSASVRSREIQATSSSGRRDSRPAASCHRTATPRPVNRVRQPPISLASTLSSCAGSNGAIQLAQHGFLPGQSQRRFLRLLACRLLAPR